MSRIGNKPIPIPDGVKVKADKGTVTIEGSKGSDCSTYSRVDES